MNISAKRFIKFLESFQKDSCFRDYCAKYGWHKSLNMDNLPDVIRYFISTYKELFHKSNKLNWTADTVRAVTDELLDAYHSDNFNRFYAMYHLTKMDIIRLNRYFRLISRGVYGDKTNIIQYYEENIIDGAFMELLNIDHINTIIRHFENDIPAPYYELLMSVSYPHVCWQGIDSRSYLIKRFQCQTRMYQIIYDQMLVENNQRVYNSTLEREYVFRLKISSNGIGDARFVEQMSEKNANVIRRHMKMASVKILLWFVRYYNLVEYNSNR